MVKLIASDLDGTLLKSNHEIPKGFEEMLNELDKRNIHMVLASGRSVFTIEHKFKEFADRLMFIGDNGACIKKNGVSEVLLEIPQEELPELIKSIQKYPQINTIICTEDMAYSPSPDDAFLDYSREFYSNLQAIDSCDEVTKPVLKVAMHCETKWNDPSTYDFYAWADKLNITLSGNNWIDIMPKGVNKGMAMRQLQTELGVSPEETMAFGDYLNDIELLQQAKYSYAVSGAHPEVHKIANHTAPSNDEEGVIKIINKMLEEI